MLKPSPFPLLRPPHICGTPCWSSNCRHGDGAVCEAMMIFFLRVFDRDPDGRLSVGSVCLSPLIPVFGNVWALSSSIERRTWAPRTRFETDPAISEDLPLARQIYADSLRWRVLFQRTAPLKSKRHAFISIFVQLNQRFSGTRMKYFYFRCERQLVKYCVLRRESWLFAITWRVSISSA